MPDDAEAHFIIGNIYDKLDRYDEAIDAYKQAIRIDPKQASAHSRLGKICLKLNKVDSALEQFKILKHMDKDLANELFDTIYPD